MHDFKNKLKARIDSEFQGGQHSVYLSNNQHFVSHFQLNGVFSDKNSTN